MTQTATKSTQLTTTVQGSLVRGSATEVAITARQFDFTVDEPAALGGTDKGANPIEHLLAALASCTVISYQVWADTLGLTLEGVDVDLSGDIDVAGFFGTAEGVRPGFQGIELGVRLSGPESEADYRRLEEAVAAHCPVLDNLTHGVPVRTTVEVSTA
ncbi:OsmC family protein [Janibacter sp. GS2]|uniref:OsmC family protein n=1 Tax=Janibacter sp. GS2 TaxID=3442646 RepID=UPI003EC0B352